MKLICTEELVLFATENEIYSKKLVLTDKNKAQLLLEDMQNLKKWIPTTSKSLEWSVSQEKIDYGSYWTDSVENKEGTWVKTWVKTSYLNRTPFTWELLTNQCYSMKHWSEECPVELMDLFMDVDGRRRKESRLKNFKESKAIVDDIKDAKVSEEVMEEIIKGMWPDFGLFAIDGLNCFDFETEKKHEIESFKELFTLSNKYPGLEFPKIQSIWDKREIASDNQKVYTFAKEVNSMFKK